MITWIFVVFLPSLMEGRKFNPAYKAGKELNFPLLESNTLVNLKLASCNHVNPWPRPGIEKMVFTIEFSYKVISHIQYPITSRQGGPVKCFVSVFKGGVKCNVLFRFSKEV
jgi:hypothetical protein